MKLLIDIDDRLYNDIRNCKDVQIASHEAIKNGIPYEERQISHEQECIIEELENICINNEYVLDLLSKLKNGGES